MATPQEQMKARLESVGIPAKEIKVYGSQIMVTCVGQPTAARWHTLLYKFCKRVKSGETLEHTKKNSNTVLLPSVTKVWKIWGTV
jgi:hypothetical protein